MSGVEVMGFLQMEGIDERIGKREGWFDAEEKSVLIMSEFF